jgi:hypothetical protein
VSEQRWIYWDRSVPLPEGLIFPVVLLDLSWDFSTPKRFYHDGVIAYFPVSLPLYETRPCEYVAPTPMALATGMGGKKEQG